MDQKIGIEFTSTGADKIVSDTRRLNKSLGTVVVTVNSLTDKLSGFQTGMGKIAAATKEAAAAMEESASMAAKAAQAGEKVAQSMARSQGIVNKLRKAAGSSGGVSGTGSGGTRGPRGGPRGTFMGMEGLGIGRITGAMGLYGGYHYASQAVSNAVLGKSRAEIVDDLRNMSTMGFTRDQLKEAEYRGDKFLRSNWVGGGIKDYLKAGTETASAWDPNNPVFKGKGQEANTQMRETAMMFAAAINSKDTGEATQLLQQTVKARLNYMPKEESDQYLKTGERSIPKLTNTIAGQMSEAVAAAMVWGNDLKHLVQKTIPTALGTGWSLPNITGMLMALRAGGAGGAQAATAVNTLLNKDVTSLAMLQAAGNEDPAARAMFKSMTPAQRTKFAKDRSKELQEQLAQSPWQTIGRMQEWFKRADAEGWDLHNHLGAGMRSLAALRPMLQSPAFLEEAMKQSQRVAGVTDTAKMMARLRVNADDPGYTEKIWANSASAFWRATSESLGKSGTFSAGVEIIDSFTDLLRSKKEVEFYDIVKASGLVEAVQGFGEWVKDTVKGGAKAIDEATEFLMGSPISKATEKAVENSTHTPFDPERKKGSWLDGFLTWKPWWSSKAPEVGEPYKDDGSAALKAEQERQAAAAKRAAFWGPSTDGFVTTPGKQSWGQYITNWASNLFSPPERMAEISGTIPAPPSSWENHTPFSPEANKPETPTQAQQGDIKIENRVFISEHELRDVVTQIIDRALRQDGQGFGTGGAGYSYGSS